MSQLWQAVFLIAKQGVHMRTYRQLTQEQRYLIYKLRGMGLSQKMIAAEVGVHPSTISRELRRNVRKRGYRPQMAHLLAMKRRAIARRETVLIPQTCARLRHYLKQGWSPEQIAGRLNRTGKLQICHQTIYTYIRLNRKEGGQLYTKLRRKGKKYRKRPLNAPPIKDRRSIGLRPAEVDLRNRIGDWELDTIVSSDRKAVILSMVERVSQYTVLAWLPRSQSMEVAKAVLRMLGPLKALVHTMTSDNGAEFAAHKYIEKRMKALFYFAHPGCPHERGLNEQVNGLVREYFPKRTNLSAIRQKDVTRVMQAINSRPRKTLNYQTPKEIFYKAVALGF